MQVHANAKLGLAGRRELVRAVDWGASLRVAAARFGVAPATAYRWCSRWRQASEPERSSLACLKDRSSRPRHSPRMLVSAEQERICAARRRTSWGPRLIAGEVGHSHSTVSKVLTRHGLSRLPRPARRQTGMSGRVRVTSCIWTPSGMPASGGLVTPSPATAQRPAPRNARPGATSTPYHRR